MCLELSDDLLVLPLVLPREHHILHVLHESGLCEYALPSEVSGVPPQF
jgi:hypothetical protein